MLLGLRRNPYGTSNRVENFLAFAVGQFDKTRAGLRPPLRFASPLCAITSTRQAGKARRTYGERSGL